ncbi:MAG: alanine/glycine:cation symporter family protein [Bacteroidia bacterium]|nr:alanine/glycine:cation symporter family protein [Bacteroidia bacterium]
MKKIFLSSLGLLLYLGICAQDTLRVSPASHQGLAMHAVIDWYRTDARINEGFARYGDPISAAIFYAPAIGEEVLYAVPGNPRPGPAFFSQPPMQVTYTRDSDHVPVFGKVYTVSRTMQNQLVLDYLTDTVVTIGSSVTMQGTTFKVDYHPEGNSTPRLDSLRLLVQYTGDTAFVRSFQFKTPRVEKPEDLNTLQQLVLTYRQQQIVGANGQISADGYQFVVTPDETATQYALVPGASYSFRVTKVMFMPLVVLMLMSGALFFTLYFRFVNLRQFKLAIEIVSGKYSKKGEAGEVSHFQALATALSGTVGLGNIAGVAIAITVGGAGATFWMILAGLLGMSSKFVECTLGVKYRQIDQHGVVSGGPMYYLRHGFAEKNMAGLGKFLAGFFAVMCIGGSLGGGNMFQVNQAFKQVANMDLVRNTWLADNAWFFGLTLAVLVGVIIIGGIKSIASVTDKMVPIMCLIYVVAGLFIIFINIGEVPRAFSEIITGAFAPTAITGGALGVLIQGFRRASFSNEAGVGSASIAHSAVRTNHPASEGVVSLLEPFIDTVVICTMTALVIVITDNHLDPGASNGVELASKAFSSQIPFFKYVLTLAVFLFALSTMISWSYYGLKAWTYLFGNTRAADITYKVLFCSFIVVGASANLGSVTDFSDAMIFAMAIPNIIGLVVLAPKVRDELARYLAHIRELRQAS